MRIVFLLPLAVGVAVAAGCGSEAREQAALSVPERDLTLQASAVAVEIASPVELQQLPTETHAVRSTRRAPRPAPAPRPGPIEPEPVIETVVPAPAPVSSPSEPASDRELPPGETVTLIPAGSGPSTAVDETDELPRVRGRPMVVRGGGTCPPRGRGPGIGITVLPHPRLR
jgi:hypothetical protein